MAKKKGASTNYKEIAKADDRTYAFKNLPFEWGSALVEYLTTLVSKPVSHKKVNKQPAHGKAEKQPAYEIYKFTSDIGEPLSVRLYQSGTIDLQGKPSYLQGEAIYFLSYCDDVSVDDMVGAINRFHDVNIKTEDVRSEMETLLPRSYGKLDDMVLKLLSPSISLRTVKKLEEEYSYYAFPALRALEGYMKYLFGIKGIHIGYNFLEVFDKELMRESTALKIADENYQKELERLYHYLMNSRHVVFYKKQLLIGTTMLKDKPEADEIVNNVLNLIETSYINIHK
ncbi:RNase LS family HEPN domain-containing protein [Aminipila luticellarii]|uniref:RNase LS family HEPN domain-containing protein n=1 Tax=Aminipila luticellarii TaxID=2507160 RepID=UPI0013E8F38B|nr:RNase LS family HEPN domain-containing protein [Aminipila luticellarii]